jgi:hypothetical protein
MDDKGGFCIIARKDGRQYLEEFLDEGLVANDARGNNGSSSSFAGHNWLVINSFLEKELLQI